MALSRRLFNRRFVVIVTLIVASQIVPASLSTTRKSTPDCVKLRQWAQANATWLPRHSTRSPNSITAAEKLRSTCFPLSRRQRCGASRCSDS